MKKGGAWAPGCVIQLGGRTDWQSAQVGYTRGRNQNVGSLRFSFIGSSKYLHRQHEHGRETALFSIVLR